VKPKCPRGMIGTPPNCKPIGKPKCPSGMIGAPPNCKSIVKLNKSGAAAPTLSRTTSKSRLGQK